MRLFCAVFMIFYACGYAESSAQKLESKLSSHLASDEDFITPQEYGKSLYEYPRSIGCVKCHGENGEEALLATYIHKGKVKSIIIPRINNLSLERFKKALAGDKGIMPKYDLTDEEINAIYLYISSKNKQPKTTQ